MPGRDGHNPFLAGKEIRTILPKETYRALFGGGALGEIAP